MNPYCDSNGSPLADRSVARAWNEGFGDAYRSFRRALREEASLYHHGSPFRQALDIALDRLDEVERRVL